MKTTSGILLAGALLSLSCSELRKDIPGPVAPVFKVHDASWIDSSNVQMNAAFHGVQLRSAQPAWNDQSCRVCHGGTYAGGTSGVSCFKCHAPYPHAIQFAPATGRHVGYMRANLYPLASCRECHGPYTGGPVVAVSCEQSGCHVDASGTPKSPETCNTCHGSFRASATLSGTALFLSAAPPRDVSGDTAASAAGVGAHQKHLITGVTGKSVKCQECHVIPTSVSDPAHLAPANPVAFGDTLANLVTGAGTYVPHPAFNTAALTCSGTYCHGSWMLKKSSAPSIAQQVYFDTATVMVGAQASPAWTDGSAAGQCTSCHGSGPGVSTPQGHQVYALSACTLCHGDVVDGNGNILNKSKHMNGVIDLVSQFGGPRPMK